MGMSSIDSSLIALANPNCRYYMLMRNVGQLKKGAIFVRDPGNREDGNKANETFKLCQKPDGSRYNGFDAGSVVFDTWINGFHSELLEEIKDAHISDLSPGRYDITVVEKGYYVINKEYD